MKTTWKRTAMAAIFAGLVTAASAQTYSVNAVGYIKLVLPPGQTLVSTPFVKVGGGVPTITDVFGTNVPNRSWRSARALAESVSAEVSRTSSWAKSDGTVHA